MGNFEEQLKSALAPAYEIERELTGAGMSRVFVAVDLALGRRVVIKVLPPELTAGVNRERFRREIQVAAQLQHPHIVTLLSAGEEGDLLYYTMPYIEGESLRHDLEKGRFAVKDVVRILHDVVDALAYAHARGVIHRDIKPGNILRQGAHALVTDFGVAKALNAAMPVSGITTAGMAIGTPAYMAPEQLAGDPSADHRLDIYAVGLLAYELLSGESPFTGPSPAATMAAQLTRVPDPLYQLRPDVPAPLSAIIMQCLAKEPNDRPPTAEALMTALDAITSSSGEIKTGEKQVLPAVAKRKRQFTIGAGVATIALASAVVVFASSRRGVPLPPPQPVASKVPVAPKVAVPPAAATAAASTMGAPIKLTAQDSLAIAEAVQRRLQREEAIHGRQQVILYADSIAAMARKVAIDSIVRATLPRGVNVAALSELGALAPGRNAIKRVVVIEPRRMKDERLNAFGVTLSEGIREALLKRKNYAVVDPDSVELVLSKTRVRSEVEKALKPGVLITPTFAGAGDTMTVIVTLRDARAGTRVASARFAAANPDAIVPTLLQNIVEQLESLRRMPPSGVRVNPNWQFREFQKDSFMFKH
jgi:hypothetical protein